MAFCLPKELATTFKRKMVSREIDPVKLISMNSFERRSFFSTFMEAEAAKHTNALFESKLLLKGQQQGIIRWAKTVTGISPKVRRDLISRALKLERVLEPKDMDSFLADLAAQRIGVEVTMGEAVDISNLAKAVDEKRKLMEKGGDRLEYGRAVVAFHNYVNGLKSDAQNVSLWESLGDIRKTTEEVAGTAKSIKASFDNSSIFRQGWKTLWTHPGIWAENAEKTFINIWNTLGGKNVVDELNADIVSRPNYDLMKEGKLGIGVLEEAYPTTWPEKIPIVGRIYKASQDAYTAFVQKTRADVFDYYIDVARKTGVTLDKQQVSAIANMVNALTGRGHLGRLEPSADFVNKVFFSPRFLKSQIDTLTAHQFQKGVTPFVRKQAAINLLKIVSGSASIMGIASMVAPGSVEFDPRSSDFGKIRVGDTRFDVTGGMGGVATLAARLLTNSTKSSTTGIVKPLGDGSFGSMDRLDVIYNFFENKLSPAFSVVRNILRNEDFDGNVPTVEGELKNLFVPLPFTSYEELSSNPNSAPILLAMIAEGLGISTNTYSREKSDTELLYEKLKDMPPEEANREVAALSDDERKKLTAYKKDLDKGMTQEDARIKNLGVKNGERAAYIWDKVSTLKTQEEKDAYILDLQNKGVMSKMVTQQIESYMGIETLVEKSDKYREVDQDFFKELQAIFKDNAIFTDPGTALQTLFSEEQIRNVAGGAILLRRMRVSESEAVKKDRDAWPTARLDHTIPRELGGGNSLGNLKVVTEEEHARYTPIENRLGRLLAAGKITERQAQYLIWNFKAGHFPASQILNLK